MKCKDCDRANQAFDEWRPTQPSAVSTITAFRAGWLARKTAQYKQAYSGGITMPKLIGLTGFEDFECAVESVAHILQNPLRYTWFVQGLGMMRTHLDEAKQYRLNIWHRALSNPNVARIHDHPWNLRSHVVAGWLTNVRYLQGTIEYQSEHANYTVSARAPSHQFQAISCGAVGHLIGLPTDVYLHPQQPERYKRGDTYSQIASEIHETHFEDGTVTINDRTNRSVNSAARVFWPMDSSFGVSAAARPATDPEVLLVTREALRRWFPAP